MLDVKDSLDCDYSAYGFDGGSCGSQVDNCIAFWRSILLRAILDTGVCGLEGVNDPGRKNHFDNVKIACDWLLDDSDSHLVFNENTRTWERSECLNVKQVIQWAFPKATGIDRILKFIRNIAQRRRNGENFTLTSEALERCLYKRQRVSAARKRAGKTKGVEQCELFVLD